MINIPQKVHDRLVAGIKKFPAVLTAAQERGANESDTVIIITAILTEVFGYDTFKEITSEHVVRGTRCDLAIKLDDKTQSLIEAKAINLELKENHVMQVVGYAANDGVDWVVLTNGVVWQIYKVIIVTAKPIDRERVVEIDFLKIDHHNQEDLASLFLFTKESWAKSALSDYYDKNQALSPFTIAQVLLTEPVLAIVKRELKWISPEIKIEIKKIRDVLEQGVLRHDVFEGEKADEARKRVTKANRARQNKAKSESDGVIAPAVETEAQGNDVLSASPASIPIQQKAS
jgi:hypothetical protein